METFLSLLGWVLLGVSAIFKAINPIVTTAIAERHKTERARISSPRNAQAAPIEAKKTISTSPDKDSRWSQKADRLIGLVATLAASGQFALLQFGSLHAAPLSVGNVAFMAQGLMLFGLGWSLLSRR